MLSVVFMTIDMDVKEKHLFEKIYNKYKNVLYNVAYGISKNEKDAEDILQNAFIKVAKNIRSIYDTDSKETLSFLMVITKNTAYDFLRKRTKISEMPLSDIEKIPTKDSAIESIVSKLEYQSIVQAIIQIPSPYNEVLYLHYVKDYSIKKTATLLDRKIATVKMQFVRGKKMLMAKLEEVLYE